MPMRPCRRSTSAGSSPVIVATRALTRAIAAGSRLPRSRSVR
ncbi:MAG: hypothetical protein WDN49_12910 [Acetobacteraceae bacterium]